MHMKPKHLIIAGSVLLAAALTGCGGDSDSPKALDTAGVLNLARQTSETATPLTVNEGAVTVTDGSETAEPVVVN